MSHDLYQLALIDAVLDLLPPMIRGSLLENKAFRDRFDLRTTASITLDQSDLTYRREELFRGIREALENPDTPVVVEDENRHYWRVSIEESEGIRHTVLESDERRIYLPDFWALSPEQTVRVRGFDKEVEAINFHDDSAQDWRNSLTDKAVVDEDYDLLHKELRLTPTRVAERIADSIESGSSNIRSLIPDDLRYYERLVGSSTASDSLDSYASSRAKAHITQLMNWNPVEGFKLSLLLSSHSLFTSAIDSQVLKAGVTETVFTWVEKQGDLISKLGAIELGLSLLDSMPQLEPILERMIEDIRVEDPDDETGRFSLLSSLIVLVCGELARTQVLLGKPPFWTRLAAIAQASLVERIIITSSVEPRDFASWAHKSRGQLFYLRALVDLRVEPRWLPDSISALQLKAEFLGRIANAASDNQWRIHSPKLRQLLLEDGPVGIKALMTFPFPFLPGPLEGGHESKMEMPAEVLTDLEEKLASECLHPTSFAGLVNSVLIFRIEPDHARLAATALRKVKYQLQQSDGDAHLFSLIHGLATVAAVTRSKELADEIRILSRVTRRRNRAAMSTESEVRISMIAAASRENPDDWASFAGDWLTELAFEITRPEDVVLLQSHLHQLIKFAPALAITCAKADAALSSFIH